MEAPKKSRSEKALPHLSATPDVCVQRASVSRLSFVGYYGRHPVQRRSVGGRFQWLRRTRDPQPASKGPKGVVGPVDPRVQKY